MKYIPRLEGWEFFFIVFSYKFPLNRISILRKRNEIEFGVAHINKNKTENLKVRKHCPSVYRHGGPAGIPEDKSSDSGVWTGELSITGVCTQVCLLILILNRHTCF